jgi:hypothetical protein
MVEDDFMEFISKEQLEEIRKQIAKKTPKQFRNEIPRPSKPSFNGKADQDDLSKQGQPQPNKDLSENSSEDAKG